MTSTRTPQQQPDTSKGSFYANPEVETPPHSNDQHPEYCRPNIWPSDNLPSLRPAFVAAGAAALQAGYLLAGAIDALLRQYKGAPADCPSLEALLRSSQCHKGRLLHYFAPRQAAGSDDSWCGWHFDHSALTGMRGWRVLKEQHVYEDGDV